jgi:hypothetical protein
MFIFRKKIMTLWNKNKRLVTYNLLLLAFFFLPMFYQLVGTTGLARYSWVSIIDEGAIAQINEARNGSSLSPTLARAVHNKGTFFANIFLRNWTSHYSEDFIFFEGGSDYQFNVPGRGLIYPINAAFLIIGVFVLLKRRDKTTLILLGWFYFGSVASSLTREAPHTLRAITMLPSPMIITAFGVTASLAYVRRKLADHRSLITDHALLLVYFAIVMMFGYDYFNKYFNEYRSAYSWSWQYGYKQVVEYVKENYDDYDKIIISKKYGEPHEFILFYWPWDPESYQNDSNLNRFYQSKWYWVDGFDKFWFVNDWEVVRKTPDEERDTRYEFVLESGDLVNCQLSQINCLLVTSPGNVPDGWNKLKTLNFLDNKPAFEAYENR